MPFSARLDDLRPNRRRSAGFSDQVDEIVAHSLSEVMPAIDAVTAAAEAELWAVGFVAYDAAPAFDRNLVVPVRDSFHDGLPLVWFGLYRTRTLNPETDRAMGAYELAPWEWVETRTEYERDVAAIRDHIEAGDTYQVNYSSRLRSRFTGDPVALYHDLAAAQSGGYGTYLDTGRFQIVSASPELFFDRHPIDDRTDRLITRPMKGTARRGRWAAEDAERRALLEASDKDRAENLIIVDLLRNDLGRVARFGTVTVSDLMRIERFDTVWQMTSSIEAEIAADTPLRDVFTALFPCGSITGAPKVRTMQIISELESAARGVYTGAIGFISPPGMPGPRASFSVGIRTVVIDGETGDAEYGIGGGVTWDSAPEREYEEAALKSEILRYGRTDFELLETLRWNPVSGWYWLDYHLDRMAASAEYFGLPLDRSQLSDRLDAAVGGDNDLRVRLTVDRQGRASVAVTVQPRTGAKSVAVAVDREPVDVQSPFLFHKTTRREVYEERQARHPHADDVLLVNGNGDLTESAIANVVVKLNGAWYTPPIEAGCLPGIYRRVLLEEGRISERRILLADLEDCQGIALINSVQLWRPAFIVDD